MSDVTDTAALGVCVALADDGVRDVVDVVGVGASTLDFVAAERVSATVAWSPIVFLLGGRQHLWRGRRPK